MSKWARWVSPGVIREPSTTQPENPPPPGPRARLDAVIAVSTTVAAGKIAGRPI